MRLHAIFGDVACIASCRHLIKKPYLPIYLILPNLIDFHCAEKLIEQDQYQTTVNLLLNSGQLKMTIV